MSDAERLDALLPDLKQLDRGAFTELYDLMAGQLLAFAHGLLGDRATAEDVVQDVFVRLTRHARRFRGDGRALLAWLYTTARRACIDQRRRHRRRRERLVDEVPDAPGGDAPELPGHDPEVVAALAELTEKQRTVVVLRRVVGLSGEEVADVLDLDREAVYALCARAEAQLRVQLTAPSDHGRAARPSHGGRRQSRE